MKRDEVSRKDVSVNVGVGGYAALCTEDRYLVVTFERELIEQRRVSKLPARVCEGSCRCSSEVGQQGSWRETLDRGNPCEFSRHRRLERG